MDTSLVLWSCMPCIEINDEEISDILNFETQGHIGTTHRQS